MFRRTEISLTWPKQIFILLLSLFVLAGCKSAPVGTLATGPDFTLPTSEATLTTAITPLLSATATKLPTLIPTDTPSPTPTITPAPTAVPITITGDPRAAVLQNPDLQDNVLCGVVDWLDFPLDPPEALTVSYGGQGFGRFRSRYDQYHAGEDWQLVRGRSNLGVPVYAIGHGRIVYAHPYGWGTDQGVIIVRHTFADGRTFLSFYGHMDPESVTLRAGDCVVRGQEIAKIGQPRTPPHLHFEIRTHMSGEPGPGYWPVDPTEAGWLPPSQFIWNYRMAATPGVVWTRLMTAESRQNIYQGSGNTLITQEDNQLMGFNAADGRLLWQHPLSATVSSVSVDTSQSLLYMATRPGQVSAYPLLAESEDGVVTMSEEPLWQVELGMVGSPTLLPLPGGGVVVSVRQELTAISANGAVLWQAELERQPVDWLLADDLLILTVANDVGPMYALTVSGLQTWSIPMHGRPIQVGTQLWLYREDGLYRLDPATMTTELLYPLPPSFLGLGSVVALPDGEVIIVHRDRDDRRLIAFNADGTVRWQRSYALLGPQKVQLLLHHNQPYLLVESSNDVSTWLMLYAIDRQKATLQLIFTGGTRSPLPGGEWFVSINDELLGINIGGGSIAILNPELAISLANSPTH